jgi:hypothetical protein
VAQCQTESQAVLLMWTEPCKEALVFMTLDIS